MSKFLTASVAGCEVLVTPDFGGSASRAAAVRNFVFIASTSTRGFAFFASANQLHKFRDVGK